MTGSDERDPQDDEAVESPPGEGSASGSRSGSTEIPAVPVPTAEAAAETSSGKQLPELPDFRLLAKIGQGGFGSVWVAQHRHTGDAVAIKFIAPESREIELKGLQHLRQRVREGQEHLVWPEYIGEAGDFIYCVMDLADPVVEGPLFADRYEALTLLRYAKQKGRLDLVEAAGVTLSIAKGLSFLQSAGLRHGDIKPANILRVRGKWKLIDYGMMGGLEAKARGGTRSYLPPEGPHGDRADQYALGVVLHELVFGHRPNANVQEPWPDSRLASGVRRVQQRLADQDPSRRFPSSSDLVQELESLLSSSKPAVTGAAGACPSCGEPIFSSDEACGSCGSELWRECPLCQHRGSIVQRYCTQCRGPVYGIFAMRKELNEADALLNDGVHRDCLRRLEGPLRDLLHEVARDLTKLRGGDLSRHRRVEAIAVEFEGRMARMADRCGLLQQIDVRISDAHERADVTVLRESIVRALEIAPGASTYERLRADLPLLEARSRWAALLARLGNPHLDPSKLSSERLRTTISTLRGNLPKQAVARVEAKVALAALQDEQRSRVRERCRRTAAWHEGEQRPLQALRWLRIAESKQAVDTPMKASIIRLLSELRPLSEELQASGREVLQQIGGHREMRRIAWDLSIIEEADSDLVVKLRAEWPRRRRLDLLRRIANRALACVSRGEFAAADAWLAMAHRIADRDPAARDRVIDLDNSIAARIRAVRDLLGVAIADELAGRPQAALRSLEQAAEIAPGWHEVSSRVGRARVAAALVPIRRRRRLMLTACVMSVLLLFGAVFSYHLVTLAPLRSTASALAESTGASGAGVRRQAIDLLSGLAGRKAWLLSDLGLVDEVRREWASSWTRTYGTEGPLDAGIASTAANELAAWRLLDEVVESPPWADSASLRLASGVLAARTTRAGRLNTWRAAVDLAARSGANVGMVVDLIRPEVEAVLDEPVPAGTLEASLKAIDDLAATLDSHPQARELLRLVLDAKHRWCDESIRELRFELGAAVAQAMLPSEGVVDAAGPVGSQGASPCGEVVSSLRTALSRLQDERRWTRVVVEFEGGSPRVGPDRGESETARGFSLRLIPIEFEGRLLLAASEPISNATWRTLAGEVGGSEVSGLRVELSIDEARAFCDQLPSFAYLGRSWRAIVPSAAEWGAAWREHQSGGALRFDGEHYEWLAGEHEQLGDDTVAPSIRAGQLRDAKVQGDDLTVLRPFFEPVELPQGSIDPLWFELASQPDSTLANSGDPRS